MKLPENTIQITVSIDEDDDIMDVYLDENLSDDMSDEQATFYLDVFNGVMGKLQTTSEEFRTFGALLRKISYLEHELYEEDGLVFEPDEALLEALNLKEDTNIVSFKKKMH
jgi:hypothetical protein|tara:strand:+ start:1331 stop:1663 length:333 start_codon:yes stop_codon:yes gene_type:complete